MVGGHDEEHARRHLAHGIIHHAFLAEDAAVGLQAEHLVQLGDGGARAVHVGHVRNEAGGVGEGGHLDHGLGSVNELHQHVGIEAAAGGFGSVRLRHGFAIERVVLALAGGHDLQADRARERVKLHQRGGLVARRHGVDDARLLGLAAQHGADGHVRFHVHHDDVLAVGEAVERDARAGGGSAGGVDHGFDGIDLRDERGVLGDDELARAGGVVGFPRRARVHHALGGNAGDLVGRSGAGEVDIGHRRRFDAAHAAHFADDIDTHLPGADDGEAHRPPFGGAPPQVFVHADHNSSPRFGTITALSTFPSRISENARAASSSG